MTDAKGPKNWVRILHLVWSGSCLFMFVLLIAVRWLRYTSWSTSPPLDSVLRELMVFDAQAFLWPWAYSTLDGRTALLALTILVIALHRRLPHYLARRTDGVWRLTPLAVSLLATAMLWFHYAFDVNPTVTLACATSLALAWLTEQPRMKRMLPAAALLAAWGIFFLGWIIAARDAADRLTIGAWAVFLFGTSWLLAPSVGRSELTLFRGAGIMAMNLLAAMLPLFVPLHGGTYLGPGLAYSFCENADRGSLYASVPACNSVRATYDACRDGRIVEYDLRTMKRVAAYDFFSPDFYGRLEMLTCLPDEVQVAVQACMYRGRPITLSALAFPVAAPNTFNPVAAGEGLGLMPTYDEKHDTVFYSGEFTNLVVRYDRRGQRFDTPGREAFFHQWYEPVALRAFGGSIVMHPTSIHPGRNRIYLADWMQGRYAYAMDLTTLQVVGQYDVGSGGALGISVDPERDRLFVTSLWGLEVFDLATDTLVARIRTGLGNRPVIVDRVRNRLYLSSMVEGKIRILDRDTLEILGQIPIGIGSRYAHLSSDGTHFFASSTSAYYYWDADGLLPSR